MSDFIAQSLVTGNTLSQSFSLKLNTRYKVAAFYPFLYIHGAPAGIFTFSVKDENLLIVYSKTFTSADIKTALSTVNNYVRCFYPVIPVAPLALDKGTFFFELSASGYVNSPTQFIAWIQQHEDLNNDLDYVPTNDAENPLALRLKVFKEGIL